MPMFTPGHLQSSSLPDSERLNAILRDRNGQLNDTPYPVLLLALARAEKSAVLEIRRNQLDKRIIFDAGSPVDCWSNIATETLLRFLVTQKKITEADSQIALNVSAAQGIPLGEVLTEKKLITPTELYRMLQQNLGRKLLEPFSWKTGTWEISYDVPAISSALRVKTPQLLMTGIMKVEAQEVCDEALAGVGAKHLSLPVNPLFGLGDIKLTKDQQKVVDAAQKAEKLDDIRKSAGIDSEDLNRIVYALMLLGIVALTDQPRIEVPSFFEDIDIPPAAPQPVVAPPPPPPAPVAPVGANAEEVMAAYLSFRRKDPFELLGVEETDGPVTFNRRFIELSDRFHPSRFDEKAADGLREKVQEVFLAYARAYAELAHPDRRAALIKRREKLREEAAAAAQRGTAALIDPEALYTSGRNMVAAGKLREALSSFEMAMECDAQNGTYAAEVAWIRYQLQVTPPLAALKLLKNAMRIDPNAAIAYLYTGCIQAVLGQKMEASAYVDRAEKLLRGDPRVAEAKKKYRL